MSSEARPIIWSIAGTDSGGGAGLAADQRAAEACGVHLCPVVAAVTAQNSVAVTRVAPVAADVLDAQLVALADDLPPAAIKTGLLGSAENIAVVARWIDRLRTRGPVALVVDPVLGASTGAAFADDAVVQAYVRELLPRATLITPNRREAARLLGDAAEPGTDAMPSVARRLHELGAQGVCITGGDAIGADDLALDWLHTPHASGWLALPRVDTSHTHGTGCTFATSAAAAMARGFVTADAGVLAKMATTQALRHGFAAGQGRGPVRAQSGFANDPTLLSQMSWGEAPRFTAFGSEGHVFQDWGLYGIVDSLEGVQKLLDAGVRTLQLRMKSPERPTLAWRQALHHAIDASLQAADEAAADDDVRLFINDHADVAIACGARAIHLGQEDLLALGDAGRQKLIDSGVQVGVSSHSLWELARARSLPAGTLAYVACGPVWPTLTKAMPWHAQGLDNLAWWVHMAGVPVVAIGGILDSENVKLAAQSGAAAVCVVRALGDEPALTVPGLNDALLAGRLASALPVPEWPHPSLST